MWMPFLDVCHWNATCGMMTLLLKRIALNQMSSVHHLLFHVLIYITEYYFEVANSDIIFSMMKGVYWRRHVVQRHLLHCPLWHLCADNRRSICFQQYSSMACEHPLMGTYTRSECCCSIGKAFGEPCHVCPLAESGQSVFFGFLRQLRKYFSGWKMNRTELFSLMGSHSQQFDCHVLLLYRGYILRLVSIF